MISLHLGTQVIKRHMLGSFKKKTYPLMSEIQKVIDYEPNTTAQLKSK